MALAQDFSFGPVPAGALLHARPRSEMPRQACALRPRLELSNFIEFFDTSAPHIGSKQEYRPCMSFPEASSPQCWWR